MNDSGPDVVAPAPDTEPGTLPPPPEPPTELAQPLPTLETFNTQPVTEVADVSDKKTSQIAYDTVVNGLDELGLEDEFNGFSALKKGKGKAANAVMVRARAREDSLDRLVEWPAQRAALGDVSGLSVLDIGCGDGSKLAELVRAGAVDSVGIDVRDDLLSDPPSGMTLARGDISSLFEVSEIRGRRFDRPAQGGRRHCAEDADRPPDRTDRHDRGVADRAQHARRGDRRARRRGHPGPRQALSRQGHPGDGRRPGRR